MSDDDGVRRVRFADVMDPTLDISTIDPEELADAMLRNKFAAYERMTLEQAIGVLISGILVMRDTNERLRQKLDVNTTIEFPDEIRIAFATDPREAKMLVTKFEEDVPGSEEGTSKIVEIKFATKDIENIGRAFAEPPWEALLS